MNPEIARAQPVTSLAGHFAQRRRQRLEPPYAEVIDQTPAARRLVFQVVGRGAGLFGEHKGAVAELAGAGR